jgi:hypothetical protein
MMSLVSSLARNFEHKLTLSSGTAFRSYSHPGLSLARPLRTSPSATVFHTLSSKQFGVRHMGQLSSQVRWSRGPEDFDIPQSVTGKILAILETEAVKKQKKLEAKEFLFSRSTKLTGSNKAGELLLSLFSFEKLCEVQKAFKWQASTLEVSKRGNQSYFESEVRRLKEVVSSFKRELSKEGLEFMGAVATQFVTGNFLQKDSKLSEEDRKLAAELSVFTLCRSMSVSLLNKSQEEIKDLTSLINCSIEISSVDVIVVPEVSVHATICSQIVMYVVDPHRKLELFSPSLES